MLVLTRRIGEEIYINKGAIQIKLLYVKNGTIVIGIKAPDDIDIERKELFVRKHPALNTNKRTTEI